MKRKPVPKKTRLTVWEKYGRKCAYCGCDLEYKDMQVDHLKSVARARWERLDEETVNDESNLMPSCRMCNYYKDTAGIEAFRRKLAETLAHTSVASFQARLAVKYNMIEIHEWDKLFWFEKYTDKHEDN